MQNIPVFVEIIIQRAARRGDASNGPHLFIFQKLKLIPLFFFLVFCIEITKWEKSFFIAWTEFCFVLFFVCTVPACMRSCPLKAIYSPCKQHWTASKSRRNTESATANRINSRREFKIKFMAVIRNNIIQEITSVWILKYLQWRNVWKKMK